jgi:hypothetical protein
MRYKIVKCFGINNQEGKGFKTVWVYPWKEWTDFLSRDSRVEEQHRVLWFLSLKAHITIERALGELSDILLLRFPYKKLLFFYDVIHGLISAYNVKEILEWWKNRPEDDEAID